MTEEQKQALIEWCNWRIAKGKNTLLADASYDAAVVALAALTAQPVKLPKKEKALIGRDYLYVYCAGPVESAIRAAGYQVESE
ncbi:hypothetical protein [Pantoea agglomerans]|uniref:hypothetical protein n=1 Tax=Enterobacter agglomerans TaxID=549 RepID=UPI00244AD413|nr:hypothetical protein [Pantoea agglomerans]MDH1171404.1 hypothetical protein [Pantoea agglomerans]